MQTLKRTLLSTLIFAIAMGFLEAIVVIYLRDIYYSGGFKFPLMIIPDSTLRIEILREFCTLVMLLSISFIAGKSKLGILSYFLISFAVWDISYYIGLKLILKWPPSLFTWDILFLIPIPWIGPVLAPLISSFSMILLALVFLVLQNKNSAFKSRLGDWLFILLGAVLIFVSFIWDYGRTILENNLLGNILSLRQSSFITVTRNYIPHYFHWDLFILGLISIYFAIFLLIKRYNFISKEL